jgi:hypothetical protein
VTWGRLLLPLWSGIAESRATARNLFNRPLKGARRRLHGWHGFEVPKRFSAFATRHGWREITPNLDSPDTKKCDGLRIAIRVDAIRTSGTNGGCAFGTFLKMRIGLWGKVKETKVARGPLL